MLSLICEKLSVVHNQEKKVEMLLKATWVWLLIVAAAILNGFLREKVLVSMLGTAAALPASGVLLAILIFLIALMSIPFIHPADTKACIRIGLYWLVLTLSFEFLFGYFIMGKSWNEIVQVFNVLQGDLFILVLLTTGFSPWLAVKCQRHTGQTNQTNLINSKKKEN